MSVASTLPSRLSVAAGFLGRLRGLLGSDAEETRGSWLLIVPCSSIHTLGMRYAIDIAFLGERGEVLRVEEAVRPGRLRLGARGAVAVVERPAGGGGEVWLKPGAKAPVNVLDALSRERGSA